MIVLLPSYFLDIINCFRCMSIKIISVHSFWLIKTHTKAQSCLIRPNPYSNHEVNVLFVHDLYLNIPKRSLKDDVINDVIVIPWVVRLYVEIIHEL